MGTHAGTEKKKKELRGPKTYSVVSPHLTGGCADEGGGEIRSIVGVTRRPHEEDLLNRSDKCILRSRRWRRGSELFIKKKGCAWVTVQEREGRFSLRVRKRTGQWGSRSVTAKGGPIAAHSL